MPSKVYAISNLSAAAALRYGRNVSQGIMAMEKKIVVNPCEFLYEGVTGISDDSMIACSACEAQECPKPDNKFDVCHECFHVPLKGE